MERSIIHLNVADFAVAVERAVDGRLRDRPVIIAPAGAARAAVYDMSEEAYRSGIRKGATPRHVPAKIIAVAEIPRTKSGKIVEIAVRSVVHGENVKNTEALANPEALQYFRDIPELSTA